MPRLPSDYVPAYRLHKQSGKAITTLSGRDHVLGPFGSLESQARYHGLVPRWIANGRRPLDILPLDTTPASIAVTVATLCDAFQRHAETYYAAPGKRTNASAVFKLVLRDVTDLFGSTPADSFTPSKLKAVRERWIARGCGNRGCLETVATDTAFARAVSRRLGQKTSKDWRHSRDAAADDALLHCARHGGRRGRVG